VAAIITSGFIREARVQRAALGADTLEPVIITHPLSTLSDEQIGTRADEVVSQIQTVLTCA